MNGRLCVPSRSALAMSSFASETEKRDCVGVIRSLLESLQVGCCISTWQVLVFPAGTDTGVARSELSNIFTLQCWDSCLAVARGSLSVFLEVR